MADYITAIRTAEGDKQIDYNALANLPDLSASSLGVAPASHTHTFFTAGTSAPSNTSVLWIDTNATTGGLKYYDGSAWVHVPVAYT